VTFLVDNVVKLISEIRVDGDSLQFGSTLELILCYQSWIIIFNHTIANLSEKVLTSLVLSDVLKFKFGGSIACDAEAALCYFGFGKPVNFYVKEVSSLWQVVKFKIGISLIQRSLTLYILLNFEFFVLFI